MAADIGSRRVRPEWRSSVRWRVTAGASLVLGVALVVAGLASAGLLRRALTSDAETPLVDRADEIESLIASGQLTAVRSAGNSGPGVVVDARDNRRRDATTGEPSACDSGHPRRAPATETVRGEAIGGLAAKGTEGRETVPPRVATDILRIASRQRTAPSVSAQHDVAVFRSGRPGRRLITGELGQAWPRHAMPSRSCIEAADLSGRVRAVRAMRDHPLGFDLNRMLDRLDEAPHASVRGVGLT